MLPGNVKLTIFILWTSASFGKTTLSPTCSSMTDSKEWSVTGICTVVAQRKDGWCELKESLKGGTSAVRGQFTSVKLSNSGDYIWNCSAEMDLPLSNGWHNYEIRFAEAVATWRLAFSVRVEDPGQPILKNCPEHVTENNGVTCECSSQRDGDPRPVFSWPGQTDSSILSLYNVAVNATYSCEMNWGKQKKAVTYSLLVITGEKASDASTSSVQITGVIVAAVFFIILVITIVVIVIIRRKRNIWTRLSSTKPRLSEVELTENSFYGDFEVDSERECNIVHNVNEDSSMQTGKTIQPDVYTTVENDERGQTIASDLYANVEMNEGRQAPQAELYAAVEKNKERQPVQLDLYAAVVKSSGKQKAKAGKLKTLGGKQEFTSKGDVNTAVDKGANSEIQGEETYAQVVKLAK